jgi:phytanoyl-CoA hydroxylase
MNPITTALRDQFTEQGYLLVSNVFDPVTDLQPLIEDYTSLLDRLTATWHAKGQMSSTYQELPFAERLIKVIAEAPVDLSRYFDISLPDDVITEETPMHTSEAVFKLLTNPRLLDYVEMLIGGEIYSNPIQHVRIKPPERTVQRHTEQSFLVKRTGWHQDQGVARPEADETDMLTVWLPLWEATEENGCLCLIPGSHREGLTQHCPGEKRLIIPDKLLNGAQVPVPMPPGSVLFLHRLTKHASLSNVGEGIRWSFDLRYQPIGQPTGRSEFPGFVARSRQHPESELRDWRAWDQAWRTARAALAKQGSRAKKHRWNEDAALCA